MIYHICLCAYFLMSFNFHFFSDVNLSNFPSKLGPEFSSSNELSLYPYFKFTFILVLVHVYFPLRLFSPLTSSSLKYKVHVVLPTSRSYVCRYSSSKELTL